LSTISKIDKENKIKLLSVKCIWTGAGMINPKHQDKILKLIDNVELYHSYGMTETTFIVFSGQYNANKPGSPGKLLPIFKCKVCKQFILNNFLLKYIVI
jgi:long-subunit acyl-CoA synthetase (AMP-forming)